MADKEPKSLAQRFLDARKEIKVMTPEGYNDHFNYNYLSDAQIVSRIKTVLDKHGILFIYNSKSLGFQIFEHKFTDKWNNEKVERTIYNRVSVEYHFASADDSADMISGEGLGESLDKGDKGVYKAITGAIKYIYIKTFLIPTKDDPETDNNTLDTERKVTPDVTQEQPPATQTKPAAAKITVANFDAIQDPEEKKKAIDLDKRLKKVATKEDLSKLAGEIAALSEEAKEQLRVSYGNAMKLLKAKTAAKTEEKPKPSKAEKETK